MRHTQTKRLPALAVALLLTAALAVNASAQPITAGKHTQVTTVYGPIEGYQDGSIFTFKGIRYAKAERFMPPQSPDKFTEVRQCKVWGPQAPQGESLHWNDRNSQTDYGFGNQFVTEPMDERGCLVLNVWTPSISDGKRRPVFVWIHGGGYTGGSAHDLPCYEGRALAEAGDIVVVSLNHRLNVLTPTSLGWAYWVGRMGVAYVEAAKKYAIVIQYNDNVLICTCNTPTGNFTKHNQIDMTNTIGTPNTGDQTVFTDPDTGKSYLVYSYGKGRS